MSESLAVTFLGHDLTAPLVLPAGVVGMTSSSLKGAIDGGAGIVTSKSLTMEPRKGHKGPVVSSFEGGLMNCMGLCNPGIDRGLEDLGRFRDICKAPLIVSIFSTDVEGFVRLAMKVSSEHGHFLELNLSCPNVHQEFGVPLSTSPEAVKDAVSRVKDICPIPVIAKLTPNTPDIAGIAVAAAEGGADALCLINTVGPGMAIDIVAKKPILSNIVGGMSGPAVKPIALRCVYEAKHATGLPIIGMGGISSGEDVIEMMMAGADIVGIGTAVYYRGARVFSAVREELVAYLDQAEMTSVNEIVAI